jgi:hypothetical protein
MRQTYILLLVAFISLGNYAQVTKKHKMEKHQNVHNVGHEMDKEAKAMMYADKVTTRLNLSLEQKEKIEQAQMRRLENQQEMMAEMMRESGNMGEQYSERKDRKKKIQEDFKAEMKQILSPVQYKNWLPMHEREMKMKNKKDVYKVNKNKQKYKDSLDYNGL